MTKPDTKRKFSISAFVKKHKILIILLLLLAVGLIWFVTNNSPHVDNLKPEDYNDNPELKKLVLAIQNRGWNLSNMINEASSDPRTYDILVLTLDSREKKIPKFFNYLFGLLQKKPTWDGWKSLFIGEHGTNELAFIRSDIVTTLSWKSKKQAELCLKGLLDPDAGVRAMAAHVLCLHGDHQGVVEALIKMLSDPDKEVRESAIYALGEIRETRAIEPLKRMLPDHPEALLALRKLEKENAFEYLIKALSSPDIDVRYRAADSLGEMGDKRAVEHLIKALDDNNDESIKSEISEALKKLGKPYRNMEKDE